MSSQQWSSKMSKRSQQSSRELNISLEKYQYDKNFPTFQKPKILGSFSLNSERCYQEDRSQLKFFNEVRFRDTNSSSFEKVRLDLNAGIDRVKHKIPSAKSEKIDHLLRWILKNKEVLKKPGDEKLQSVPAEFVCLRGLLVVLMTTLFENSNDWEVHAIKLRGTIYLCAKETKAKKEREQRMTDRDLQMASWGYKFEQYMQTDDVTSTKAQITSDSDESSHDPVDENEEFCCIFRSKLSENSIIFGAEMDGFQVNPTVKPPVSKSDVDLSTDGHFVEMKTSRLIETDRQFFNFCRFKSQKWWAQSFLVGIPKIICGFRDDDGVVRQLTEYRIDSLPKLIENPPWLPNVCMNFLDTLLKCIKSTVTRELSVYKFIWPLKSHYIIVEEDSEEEIFLPDWFIKNVFS